MSYFASLKFVINLSVGIRDAYAYIMFSEFTMPHAKAQKKNKIEKSHEWNASRTQEQQ